MFIQNIKIYKKKFPQSFEIIFLKNMKLNITLPSGIVYELEADPNEKLDKVYEIVASQLYVLPDQLKLIYDGFSMDRNETTDHYNLTELSNIYACPTLP